MDPCDKQAYASRGRVSAVGVQEVVAICRSRGEKRRVDAPRHLLIDGYNVLHAWRWIRGRDTGAGLDASRARLIEAVRQIRDLERVEVSIVFDGRGSSATPDVAVAEEGFAVIFAPAGRTADDLIEVMVAGALDPTACIVATADGLERETVAASGATCLSPVDLKDWCERCRERAVQAAARRAAKSGESWANRLPL